MPLPFRLLILISALCLALGSSGCSSSSRDNEDAVRIVGKPGRQPGEFSKPRAVTVTSDNELIVIDRTGRIQAFDLASGDFVCQWRLPAYENGTPTGMSIDPVDDSIWVADTHYMRILQYSKEGELLFQFGEEGEEPGKFVFPTDVVPDPDGRTLWICEYGRRNRIMHFTRDGQFIREWGTELFENVDLQRPMALAVSPDGLLYVVDAGNNRINVYNREGELQSQFGEPGTEPGEMKYPLDMALAPDNTLYIIEYGNSRLSRYSLDGEYLGSWGGPGHGPGEFFTPWGLAMSLDGSLVIADTNNQRLQILDDPEKVFSSSSITVAKK